MVLLLRHNNEMNFKNCIFESSPICVRKPDTFCPILHEISERKWDGNYIKDFNIINSSLEEIFMKYYKIESNRGQK